ncbi:MAG: fructose-2,6-bisphosphatase [Rhizobiaceae bacterium]|jgi:probable phosphoglycerate mutase|nr:fructose-2,6-bisphosphatase [Rhizobiaceae bacterium]
MTTTFFLLRHAAHDDVGSYLAGRSPNVFLGPEGRAQALRLGERMLRERFAVIFSSPRERTQETAQAVSVTCAVGPIELSDDLDEIDFGPWSGKTFVELNQDPAWRHWNEQRAVARTPGGESMEQVRRRVCGCMGNLSRKYQGEGVVLVSHADVIKSVVCHVLGLPVDCGFRFDIEPASLSVVVMGDWGAKLIRLNESVS